MRGKTLTKEQLRAKSLKKFARRVTESVGDLYAFVGKHCRYYTKRSRNECEDELFKLIDKHVGICLGVADWCVKNDINYGEFSKQLGAEATRLLVQTWKAKECDRLTAQAEKKKENKNGRVSG